MLNDEQLLARVRESGDAEAFAVFYRRFAEVLLAYFARRTSTPEVAADLTMEVFAAALVAAQTGTGALPDSAAGWLFGIARHKLADSYRRGEADDSVRRELGMQPTVLDDEDLRRVNELTDEGRVLELLDALPRAQRDAVRAFVIEDRSHASIASELACSEAVVRKRVSRGLKSLRHNLEEPA